MIRFILFVLFVAMPFIELALLIYLGNALGFWPTIAIVLVTALTGAYVLRAQGLATLRRVSASLSSGEPPIQPVVDGFFLAIAGAFLLTPGVITDAIGLGLLIPPVRMALAKWGVGRFLRSGAFTVHTYTTGGDGSSTHHAQTSERPDETSGPGPRKKSKKPGDGPVIDGEYEEIRK